MTPIPVAYSWITICGFLHKLQIDEVKSLFCFGYKHSVQASKRNHLKAFIVCRSDQNQCPGSFSRLPGRSRLPDSRRRCRQRRFHRRPDADVNCSGLHRHKSGRHRLHQVQRQLCVAYALKSIIPINILAHYKFRFYPILNQKVFWACKDSNPQPSSFRSLSMTP